MKGQTNSTGMGPGANAIVRTISKAGLNIINISDITKVPRGGPKKSGGRRGRRV
jgi:small subunit ribosomal protein S11